MTELIDAYFVGLVLEFIEFLDFLEGMFKHLFTITILVGVKVVAVELLPFLVEALFLMRQVEEGRNQGRRQE